MKRPRSRKILVGAVIIVVVVAVTVWLFGPAILGGRIGRSAVARAVESVLNVDASVDRLELSWRGPQSAGGLRIRDRNDRPLAELNVAVDSGLISMLLGSSDRYDVRAGGHVTLDRTDGGVELSDLRVVQDDPTSSDKASGPISLPEVPIELQLDGLAVTVRQKQDDRSIELRDLGGHLRYAPGGAIELEVTGHSAGGVASGSIEARATVTGLVGRDGGLVPKGASATARLQCQSVPLPGGAEGDRIEQLVVAARSSDLADAIDVTVRGEALAGDRHGTTSADLHVALQAHEGGALALDLDRSSGRADGKGVPAALFGRVMEVLGIVVSRDIGPSIDFQVELAEAPDRELAIDLSSDRITVKAHAIVEHGGLRGDQLHVTGTAQPGLLKAVDDVSITQPLDVDLELTSFTVPAPVDGRLPVESIAATGSLHVTGPVLVQSGGGLTIDELTAQVNTSALDQGVHLAGTARVDGAPIEFDQTLTGLIDTEGRFALGEARPAGTLGVQALPVDTIASFSASGAELARTLLGPAVTATVTLEPSDRATGVTVHGTGDGGELDLAGTWTGDSFQVTSATGRATLTPKALAQLQNDLAAPVTISRATAVTYSAEPFTLGPAEDGKPAVGELKLDVQLDEAELAATTILAEPVLLRAVQCSGQLKSGAAWRLQLDGGANVFATGTGKELARATVAMTIQGTGDARSMQGTAGLGEIAVGELARVLGHSPATLTGWLGERGSLTAEIRPAKDQSAEAIGVKARFDQLAADLTVTVDDSHLDLSSEPFQITFSADQLNTLLLGADASGGSERPTRFAADLPMTATVKRCRLPRGAKLDWAAVQLDVSMSGGPTVLARGDARAEFRDMQLHVSSENIGEHLDLELTASIAHGNHTGSTAGTGGIDLQGKISNLVTADGRLSVESSKVDVRGRAEEIPTVLVDALAHTGGRLEAGLGPIVNVEIDSSGLSGRSGRLTASMTSSNGSADAHLEGREDTIVTAAGTPINAQLTVTPALCKELLSDIHPALGDIRSADRPVRITISDAVFPLEGGMIGFNADVSIDIGDADFRAQSELLAPLKLFRDALTAGREDHRTVRGSVEPITAQIRNGVLTYQQFIIDIGNNRLRYEGTIDLVNRTLDLRTEIPLVALGGLTQQLRVLPTGIKVPVRSHGSFDDIKTDVQADRLIGNVPDALLGNLFRLFEKK